MSNADTVQVMVKSTNSERAIVSAQAFLRGMFPANGSDAWLEGEAWQPLPFYSRTLGDSDAVSGVIWAGLRYTTLN